MRDQIGRKNEEKRRCDCRSGRIEFKCPEIHKESEQERGCDGRVPSDAYVAEPFCSSQVMMIFHHASCSSRNPIEHRYWHFAVVLGFNAIRLELQEARAVINMAFFVIRLGHRIRDDGVQADSDYCEQEKIKNMAPVETVHFVFRFTKHRVRDFLKYLREATPPHAGKRLARLALFDRRPFSG